MVNYYFKPAYKHLQKVELLKIAENIEINLTLDDARFIEEITQDGWKSWYWQRLRTGRITASKFMAVCNASLSNPDKSLLTKICYPEKCGNSSKNDQTAFMIMAMESFVSQMKKLHANFSWKTVGLIVDPNYPYFAATPDALCSCQCCGDYFVEIKCPFGAAQQNASVENLMQLNDSFMETINGVYCLRQDHAFYYQLQMQMALGKQKFAIFYVWSTKFRITNKIPFDCSFWKENSMKALRFAKNVLSIELMNSYYTNTY